MNLKKQIATTLIEKIKSTFGKLMLFFKSMIGNTIKKTSNYKQSSSLENAINDFGNDLGEPEKLFENKKDNTTPTSSKSKRTLWEDTTAPLILPKPTHRSNK